jgi:chromosome segregation ATPase
MIKRMDSIGNSVTIETRSVGEIINELTLNSDTLEDKHSELVDKVNSLETELNDLSQLSDRLESLENRIDDIDLKLDETSEQIKEMATNASALVELMKQIATR